MTSGRMIVANAQLVLPGGTGTLPVGDLTIDGGTISDISLSPSTSAPHGTQVFDASGLIVMPGLVNGHYHSYGSALKGTLNYRPLECWSPYTIAWGHALSDEAVGLAIQIGAAEMLRGGVTGCIDHFPNLSLADEALTAHAKTGMRVGFAPMMQDVQDWQFFDVDLPEALRRKVDHAPITPAAFEVFFEDLYRRWHGRHDRIRVLLGPNAPQRCSEEMWTLWRKLDQNIGMHVHTHLLETRAQCRRCNEVYNGGVIAAMNQSGLLNDRLSVAHGIWTSAIERQALSDHQVTVVSTPGAELTLGDGITPLIAHIQDGTVLGLGTDSSNAGGRLSMFEEMRAALTLPRIFDRDFHRWLDPGQVSRMATTGSARAMGRDDIGEISVGKKADLVFLDGRQASLAGVETNLQTVVCHADSNVVRHVMIEGGWVLKDGEITTFDERAVVSDFAQLVPEIVQRVQPGLQTADELQPYLAPLCLH